MLSNRILGLVLIVIGVLGNNYVYLHDIIVGKHDGIVFLGWKSWVGIGVAVAVIVIGIVLSVRARAGTGTG